MWGFFVTLLVALELLAIGFVALMAFSGSGWWLFLLIIYFVWVVSVDGFGKAISSTVMGLLLATAFFYSGLLATFVLLILLLVIANIFLKSDGDSDA